MGFKLVGNLADELQRRIERLSAADAAAAIDRALMEIHDSGSYTFDLTGIHSEASVPGLGVGESGDAGTINLPADVDLRKALFVSNSSGLPMKKVPIGRLWETFAMNITPGEGYGTYTVVGRQLLFRPGTAQTVGIRYHVIYASYSSHEVTRLTPQLDELAIDLAEAKERRIFDVGGQWASQEQSTMAKIVKALDGFLSVTQEEMPLMEAAQAAHEATQIGRA